MSKVIIKYDLLDDAATAAKKVEKACKNEIDEYNDVVKILTDSKITSLDNSGYMNAALQQARERITILSETKEKYANAKAMIPAHTENLKQMDKAAGKGIDSIMNTAMGKRSIFDKIKESVYAQYINFLDKLEGTGSLGKWFSHKIREAENFLDGMGQYIHDYFKYGNGKYIMNILDSVKGVVLGTIGVITAAAAIVVTGPAWLAVVGIVGLGASVVYLGCQMVDSDVQTKENTKAFKLAQEGHLTQARYYGDIDGYQEYTKRYDFGGEKENKLRETSGDVFNFVKVTSKVTSKVCSLIGGVAKLGITQNANGETIVDWKRAKDGYIAKMFHKAGLNSNDLQTGGFDAGKGFDPIEKIFATKTEKNLVKLFGEDNGIRFIGKALDTVKNMDTISKIHKGISSLSTGNQGIYKTIDSSMDVFGNLPVVDAFFSDFWDVIKQGKSLVGLAT